MNKTTVRSILVVLVCILMPGWFFGINVSDAAQGDMPEEAAGQPPSRQTTQGESPYSLSVRGNSHFSEKELLQAAAAELQTFAQRGYRKADIDDAAFQMQSAYLQAGFAFSSVEYVYETRDNSILVSFEVKEGPQVFIEKVNFTGNMHAKSDTLLDLFYPETSRLWGRQQKITYVEAAVRDALNRIRDYYRGEGFADATVKSPGLAFNENRSRVEISIGIDEGPQYIINEVALRGEIIPELTPELEKIKSDLIGRTYYVRRKLLLRTKLEDAYDAVGYADAEFEIEAVELGAPGGIKLQAVITSGGKVRIADIVISGNTTMRESFIRSRVQLQPGDIYTKAKSRESFTKLFDSGLFTKIEIRLSDPHADGSRDLEVTVEELPSREVYIEPGWGSYEELRLRAGVFENNLFGTGREARFEGLVSTRGETITLSYADPWLLQTDVAMNVPLYYERREEPSYTSEETGLSFLFSRKFSRNLTLSTGYQFTMTQLSELSDDTPLPKGEDDYNKGTLGLQAVWDSRNDIFYPTEGLRLAGLFDISLPSLGSDLEFGRFALGCRYFFALPQEYILGVRATTGLIIPIRDQAFIPISERFFNGGDSTVRSYRHSKLGPKDENNEPVGGLGYNVFSIELRKRFYRNFSATLYVDAGNVSPNRSLLERNFVPYTSRSELFDDTMSDFFSGFKYGIGIGLQYLLPVGPIRLDMAYNPDPEEIWNEDSWVFHFSLGMAF